MGTAGKPIRVVQWATGGVGQAAIEGVVSHPGLELVGCWVHSEAKHGRDAGEIAGVGRLGVAATTSREDVYALDADCVVYAPLVPDEAEVVALLRSGKDVVTPVGWIYPDPDRSAAVLAACEEGGSTLHGTGIHPGGITEQLPLVVSGVSARVTHVRAEEFSDIRTYGAPDVVRHVMGFGATPDEALASPMAALLGAGFKASVRMVVAEMGFAADPRVETVQDVAVATAPVDSPIGTIAPGLVAARRFGWRALVDGVPVVTATVSWLMGEEHLDPPWTLGPEGERFEVEVTGDPSVSLTIKGLQPTSVEAGLVRNPGIVSTANHCVNAVPAVVAAPPGIATYLDLPMVTGRAAPHLATRARGVR